MFRRNNSPTYEASFLRTRKRPETIANQACRIDQRRGSIMPAIFDLLYREYCRARLAEMRKQLLLSVQSQEAPEADCDVSHPDGFVGRDCGFGDNRTSTQHEPRHIH
jgi:hypothetical protein